MKGRVVADGSKQRSYEGYEKSDGSFSIARTNSVIVVGDTYAHEHRCVSVIVPENTSLRSDND